MANYIAFFHSGIIMNKKTFEWDPFKNLQDAQKHHVTFMEAQHAFLDPRRVVLEDQKHSAHEKRFFCIGKITKGIITVRFTIRNQNIRIIGAGFWRAGKEIYEQKNQIY
jgi:uncharacterized DUF497 family protein